jgi:hypothetical protein
MDTTQTKVDTVRWRIHDDGGRIHNIILPNTYIIQDMLKAGCYHHNIRLKLPKMEEEPSAPHTMMPSYWNGTTGSLREPYQLITRQGMWA